MLRSNCCRRVWRDTPKTGHLAALVYRVTVAREGWLRQQEIEAERRRKRERDLNELRQLDARACTADPPQASRLLSSAKSILEQYAADAELSGLASSVIEHLSAIEKARRELAACNFQAVALLCRAWLSKYPDHAVFATLQKDADQRQKLAFIDDVKRRAAAEADLYKRRQIIKDALNQYPGEKSLEDNLRFTRNRIDLVESIAEDARVQEQAGQWDVALERWASLTTIYGNYPGLNTETARIAQKKAEALATAIARCVGEVDSLMAANDLAAATDVLRRARAEFPGAFQLADLEGRLEDAKARESRAREILMQAQAAFDRGRYQEARACLRQAVELDCGDQGLRKLAVSMLLGLHTPLRPHELARGGNVCARGGSDRAVNEDS